MKKMLFCLLFVFFPNLSSIASPNKIPEFLRSMSGCFEVNYQYVEDDPLGRPTRAVEFKSIEWMEVKEEQGKFLLENQMLREKKKEFFSHFGQIWSLTSESDKEGYSKWKVVGLGPNEENREVRSECQGFLKSSADKQFRFTCEATKAAKPRRDTGLPYEYVNRIHRYLFGDAGFHDTQENKKFTKKDELYAKEIGWNRYKRIEEKLCQEYLE